MRLSIFVFALALPACSHPKAPSPDTPDAPAASAVHIEPAHASAAPSAAAAPTVTTAASASPPVTAQAASAAASAEPPRTDPMPKVKVVNIGMHIGGGPNDDATKEPIKKSVEPHFDDFKVCWAGLGDPAAKGDFGLDLHIGKDGGKASVDHPRTALKGKPFTECVVKVFEAIDFRKPKTGVTTVSYSLRFTP